MWDGTERRMHYCPGHEKLSEDISDVKTDLAVTKNEVVNLSKRINGALDGIKDHIEHGKSWRIAIFSTVVTLILSICAGIYAYGIQTSRVHENSKDIEKLSEIIKKAVI